MKLDRFVRVAVGLVVLLVLIITIAALLFVTESALNVWDRLVTGPRMFLYGYLFGMAVLAVAAAWLVFRLVVRRKPGKAKEEQKQLSRQEIADRLRDADGSGVDTPVPVADC